MSKYLHKELRPHQPRPVSQGSQCLFQKYILVKKRLEQKNFADFMQLMIGILLGTFGIFYDATVTNSVPDLSLQKTIAVMSFMIIGIPINNKNFFKLYG